MNLIERLTTVTALCVAAATCFGADSESSTNASISSPAQSAGLVNDWLRKQTPAFNHWDVGGQIRTMYDAKWNAGSFPDSAPDRDFIRRGVDNDNDLFLLREKIHLGYQQEWVNVFVEGRDSRTWGDERQPAPFNDQFDLLQAYVRIGNPKVFPLSLKVGRQQLSYGDERFIEKADWLNLERTFDAVKLRYENDQIWVDGFVSHYVLPDEGRFNGDNWHDIFSGIYASTRTLIPKQETELYVLAHNVDADSPKIVNTAGTGPTPRDVYTVGLRAKSLPGQFGGWDYGTEIAGQFGSVNQGGVRLEHEALAVDIMGGYTWANTVGRPRFGLDFTYGSGDSNPNDGKHETFDLLFGAAHKFYGIMDVTGLRNTINPSVNFSIQPMKKLSLRADYLMYWLADTHDLSYAEVGKGRTLNGYGIHPAFSSFFGSEVDLVANYAATSWLSVQAGYSHFFVGDYIRQSVNSVSANGGTVDADYFYMLAKFNF
jgi:hypothetical protein